MSAYLPILCPDYLRSAEMTEVMMNTPSMEEIGLNPERMASLIRFEIWILCDGSKIHEDLKKVACHLQILNTVLFLACHAYCPRLATQLLDVSGAANCFHISKERSEIFPDPSDFDRCCKLKDRLPSIVVEPTEGEVESGELRWPPEEFLVQEDEQDNCEETEKDSKEQ